MKKCKGGGAATGSACDPEPVSTTKKSAHLPLFGASSARAAKPAPKVEEARAALGGRARSSALAGALVHVRTPAREQQLGAVVFADETSVDVWIGEGRIRRVRAADISIASDVGAHPLVAVAADARIFATLFEGASVRFLSPAGVTLEGTLTEKCRYGALVLGLDGKLLAVSFRRLFPVSTDQLQ